MSQPDGPVIHDAALVLIAHDRGNAAAAKEEEGADDNDGGEDLDGEEKAACHVIGHLFQRLSAKSGDCAGTHHQYGGAGNHAGGVSAF